MKNKHKKKKNIFEDYSLKSTSRAVLHKRCPPAISAGLEILINNF